MVKFFTKKNTNKTKRNSIKKLRKTTVVRNKKAQTDSHENDKEDDFLATNSPAWNSISFDIDKIAFYLRKIGLYTFLSNHSHKPHDTIVTFINRVALMLLWTYKFKYKVPMQKKNSVPWFKLIIIKYHFIIKEFLSTIHNVNNYAAATILNIIDTMNLAAKWIIIYSVNESNISLSFEDELRLTHSNQHIVASEYSQLIAFQETLRNERKLYRKLMILERAKKRDVDHQQLRFLKHIGNSVEQLKYLRSLIIDQMDWAKSLLLVTDISKKDYYTLLGLLFASFYLFAAQGRIGSFDDVTCKSYDEFINEGFAYSSIVKNKAAWSFQPIILSKISREILSIYFNHVRNLVTTDYDNDTPLWVSYSGSSLKHGVSPGKLIKKFFSSYNHNITTTYLRSLVETMAKTLLDEGKISSSERKAISDINSHSSLVTEQFYIQEDKKKALLGSKRVFSVAFNNEESDNDMDGYAYPPIDEDFHTSYQPDYDDVYNEDTFELISESNVITSPIREVSSSSKRNWLTPSGTILGTSDESQSSTTMYGVSSTPDRLRSFTAVHGFRHPEINKLGKCKWSDEEVKYIGDFIVESNDRGLGNHQIMSRLLGKIRNDHEALEIFHPNHIRSSSSLRAGWEAYVRRHVLIQL
jgi:hypothetical protein